MAQSARKNQTDRALAASVVDRVSRAWGESPFYQAQLDGPAPDRLGHQPIDPYEPDPELGDAILRGKLSIGASAVDCYGELERLWDVAGREGALHDFMHRFLWLRHLARFGVRAKEPAMRLARGWFDAHERWSPDGWAPYTTGERLIHLCCHGQLVLAAGDALWRSRVLSSMARQTRHLARAGHRAGSAYERLMTATALTVAALSLPGCEAASEKGLELLRRELRLQIRPDGGHVSRNPSRQLELVIRLQMVVKALEAQRLTPPGFLKHVVCRAAAHAQLFRAGDGKLAVFNGGYEDDGGALVAALQSVDQAVEPAGFARHSGFQRLEAGRGVLIADVGAARGGMIASNAYQSGASFHFSSGRSRIVVNCGAGDRMTGEWASALRLAAAHSTVSVDPPSIGGNIFRGAVITHRRAEEQRGHLLEIERAFAGEGADASGKGGLTHLRRFYLASRGDDLRGEDRLSRTTPAIGGVWKIRFHLHPGVKASLARDGRSVLLSLPNKEGWRFRASLNAVSLEKTVYCGAGGLPQAAEQIVISPPSSSSLEDAALADIVVKWSFRRMDGV
ncbi:MAG: heparinase II/III family protein [Parvularculaceae bacterium]|nr:heparinase II/III family protein [Parvularculaceae bacterium]